MTNQQNLARRDRRPTANLEGDTLVLLGVIVLAVVGLLAKIAILQTIGLVLAVSGVVLALLGRTGNAIGGRNHYW